MTRPGIAGAVEDASELERRLRVATEALLWLSGHVIGAGGMAPWRAQVAAKRAADGREDWREPLTRPTARIENG